VCEMLHACAYPTLVEADTRGVATTAHAAGTRTDTLTRKLQKLGIADVAMAYHGSCQSRAASDKREVVQIEDRRSKNSQQERLVGAGDRDVSKLSASLG
jgi:hypothetical protein